MKPHRAEGPESILGPVERRSYDIERHLIRRYEVAVGIEEEVDGSDARRIVLAKLLEEDSACWVRRWTVGHTAAAFEVVADRLGDLGRTQLGQLERNSLAV